MLRKLSLTAVFFICACSSSFQVSKTENMSAEELTKIGTSYLTGSDTPQSDREALNYYRLAAESGYPSAQYYLGWMYKVGRGVERDDKEAVRMFRLAAQQGEPRAQVDLGWMYVFFRGVPSQSDTEAIKYYKMAADQGYAEGQYRLADMYERGRGVKPNYEQAAIYYHKAAIQNHFLSQRNLGWLYKKGLGVAKDESVAYMWYFIYQQNKDPNSEIQLKFNLLQDEIIEAKKRGKRCIESDYVFCD
ncbi:tetratricopeptide repeat protein [Enterovibrio norvegicus]|uniref:tetratricopeptide repeat protein n=1 Tax=Enterovibrio norvegicus TaxID=188144 RepID=UPI000C867C2C|nr:tetratricopeptide repeat protein [Enterovibrio norvegicus]PML76478.1 hypothetical protein BCT69_23435 [Enterovibrio norvegicus]